jgi:hypothetical protein
MRRSVAVLAVAVCLSMPHLSRGAVPEHGKLDISVVVDDQALKGKPKNVTSAWLGYAMARAKWISDNVPAGSDLAKSYARTFDEEVAGRVALATIWSELKVAEAGLADVYLDQLQAVNDATYVREYVWTYLRSSAWQTEPGSLRLPLFQEWASGHLHEHQPETHADARVVVPGGR